MPKRILSGRVVSNANDKTITVLVERRFKHPVMKKTVKRTKKYCAHDASNAAQVGDIVQIQECSPISRTKSWRLLEAVASGT